MVLTKKDWQLFREKISGWQEAYITKLLEEYSDLLAGDLSAASKFWELEERIKQDKKTPGVYLSLKKSTVKWNIACLIYDGAIELSDLAGFSKELIEAVRSQLSSFEHDLPGLNEE